MQVLLDASNTKSPDNTKSPRSREVKTMKLPNLAALKLAVSFSLLSVVSAIPATASTINLNSGNGADAYTITADTLIPAQGVIGSTAPVITSLGYEWTNDLTSEWIGPTAAQLDSPAYATGHVTNQTSFSLPTVLNPGSPISITLLADDWATATLDGVTFYNGPAGCTPSDVTFCSADPTSWATDDVLTIPISVDDLLTSGINTLSFSVWNTGGGNDLGGSATGLDAQVAVNYTTSSSPSPAPEPPTALTLASALAVGLAFWRLQPGRQTAS